MEHYYLPIRVRVVFFFRVRAKAIAPWGPILLFRKSISVRVLLWVIASAIALIPKSHNPTLFHWRPNLNWNDQARSYLHERIWCIIWMLSTSEERHWFLAFLQFHKSHLLWYCFHANQDYIATACNAQRLRFKVYLVTVWLNLKAFAIWIQPASGHAISVYTRTEFCSTFIS
jgi:hypothetical protein